MAFWGYSFVFDSIPSETYNLYINGIDENGGLQKSTGNGNISIYKETIFRRPKPYVYGVQLSPVLEFSISFNSPSFLTAADSELAQAWLFGKQSYRKLQIVQNDISDIYFNCFLTNPKVSRVGNLIRGFECDVVCDSPFAWEFPKSFRKDYPDGLVNDTIILNNLSDNKDFYLYPTVIFETDNVGGAYVSIVNNSDGGREFKFTNLSSTELITVDNDLNMITSSTGLFRLSNFNKKWFRLVSGVNNLTITGNLNYIKFIYQFARKMAG